jgi:hypothetical protein
MSKGHWLAAPLACGMAALAGAQTADLKWHKGVKADVVEAERLAANDPVSAHRLFQEVQGRKKLSPAQAAWLQKHLSELQPRAMEVLQRDYDAAAKVGDLRGALLVAGVGEAIASGALHKEPPLEEIRKQALSGGGPPAHWRITELSATTDKGYGEGGELSFSVLVPNGSQVLRVQGRIESVGHGTDPGYAAWAFGPLKRLLGVFSATTGPHRWLDRDLIFVVNPGGELIGCAVIGKNSEMNTPQMRRRDGLLVFAPRALKPGESVKLDAVFVVPQGAAEYRLFVVGAPPVRVPAPTGP